MTSNTVVFITGCTGNGIGYHLSKTFHAAGCRVFVSGRNAAKMNHIGEGVEFVQLDVTSPESVQNAIQQVEAKAGKIDILVNNAGQGCVGPLAEVQLDRVKSTFDTNVFGLLSVTQAASVGMIQRRSGLIVNISSIVSHVPTPWAGVYCATKACVTSMSDVLRMELAGFNIKIMCVFPGAIRSSIGDANAAAFRPKEKSAYKNVVDQILARASWSQCPQSTPAEELAGEIVANALRSEPPASLSAGYRSYRAWWSYYLPRSARDYLWGSQFGIDKVGKV
ncbi:Dehydrogenase/reductase SDR family protein 7-like protein [Testicularia cyperi]|uniref:Dehydrogenase/reductase SDR family protein 7-like protein n=1 Tax=Testicularia cyperi TaxID=1882483 RepID=A0A317XG07_9BASI|nr:Dehydrogenase/reductase SDR family protein 7-like protein [Testicularia cyperi]